MSYSYERLDHVQIAAPYNGESKARAFYKDILGFEEVEKPASLRRNGSAWFRSGSVELHVGIEADFQPARKAHPAIRVKQIEALKIHLQACDITIKEDHQLPGANRFYVDDFFGNRIEFLEWE